MDVATQWKYFSLLTCDVKHFTSTWTNILCILQIEEALDILTSYVTDSKSALEKVISGSEDEKQEKPEKSKKGNVGDVLGKTLKTVS